MSTKSKWSIYAEVVAGIGFVLFLACVIFLGWFSLPFWSDELFTGTSYQPVPTDIYEIRAIEGNAGIKLPPSTREIYSYTTGFQEIFTMVRFTINADELPLFLESTLCDEPLRKVSPSSQSSHSNDPTWWEPNLAVELAGCSGGKELSEDMHFGHEILVDTTNTEYYIIYVIAGMY